MSENTNPTSGKHDALAKTIEEGVRVRDLWSLIKRFKVTTLGTIGGFLVVVFSSGYWVYPLINKPSEPPPIQRVTPKHVNIENIVLAGPAQEQYPWIVPAINFLENEADAEVAAGRWVDSFPVVVKAEPFREATTSFTVEIRPNSGHGLTGFAYRTHQQKAAEQYEPLRISRIDSKSTSATSVLVPECAAGDRLMFVLRVSGKQNIPREERDLRVLINLQVKGG